MRRMTYERRIQLLALAAGFPGPFIAMILLWHGNYSSGAVWTLAFLILSLWLGFALSLRHRVVFSLQTLSNLLAALREEDFSLRARGASSDDAMGEVMLEVNALGEVLRQQRLGAMEANALLRAVMEEIDLAVFTFDNNSKLRLVNRAGERLLGRQEERLLGFTAEELGLGACLEGEAAHTMELGFPGGSGRWGLRRERKAWQRLIRVLGHELNNSLAPIQSVAQGLESGLLSASKSSELQSEATVSILDDLRQGLGIIRSRTEALGRFMAAYAQLARLPQPKLLPVNVAEWISRSIKLETRVRVSLLKGPDVVISADADQLEQLLINLVRNAADATLETGGSVQLGWSRQGAHLDVWVVDEGLGLPNTSNLFVPFFTTKPGGSGIGLVLSRQIAEAHGGELTLNNRSDARGCRALLRLPV